MTQQPITLFAKLACPFVQRTRIVLELKGIEHELRVIDLDNRPDWFKTLSPLGKVPGLVHGDHTLFESTAINEFLEEVFPTPALLPRSPLERARARFWIQFDETTLVPAFYRLVMAQEESRRAAMRGAYLEALAVFSDHGLSNARPFLFGERPGLADITLFTHLDRHEHLVTERGLPELAPNSHVGRWRDAMRAIPEISSTAPDPRDVTIDLAPYFAGRASGATAKSIDPVSVERASRQRATESR